MSGFEVSADELIGLAPRQIRRLLTNYPKTSILWIRDGRGSASMPVKGLF
jgi:hypothetical protein